MTHGRYHRTDLHSISDIFVATTNNIAGNPKRQAVAGIISSHNDEHVITMTSCRKPGCQVIIIADSNY
jgi:5S rRNA maturation endonuclease (ribonuclease M5)